MLRNKKVTNLLVKASPRAREYMGLLNSVATIMASRNELG